MSVLGSVEAGAPDLGELQVCFPWCARPTEGSHGSHHRSRATRRGREARGCAKEGKGSAANGQYRGRSL